MNIGVITLAGKGTRLTETLKMEKQFFPFIDNKEMFLSSVYAFKKAGFTSLYLIVSLEDQVRVLNILKRENISKGIKIVIGGSSREESVRNAVLAINNDLKEDDKDTSIIFIHDGDRPFIKPKLINKLSEELKGYSGVIPYTRQTSSVFDLKEQKYLKRENLAEIQTPQVFKFNDLFESFNSIKGKEKDFCDEGQILLTCDKKVNFTPGDSMNIKISDENSLHIGLYYLREINKHD